MTRFRSVVLDVDSTLCSIEGIDWLAQRRGLEIARHVVETTERAMNGELALDSVYGERLSLVRPSRGDIEALAEAYRGSIAPGAAETVRVLRESGVTLMLVSGGIRQAILPLATDLGFAPEQVQAVTLRWDARGEYVGFDPSPLTTDRGKRDVVRSAALPRPVLAMGDGSTDLAMSEAVAAFAAFTGFVHREPVVAGADLVISNFRDLTVIVNGEAESGQRRPQ